MTPPRALFNLAPLEPTVGKAGAQGEEAPPREVGAPRAPAAPDPRPSAPSPGLRLEPGGCSQRSDGATAPPAGRSGFPGPSWPQSPRKESLRGRGRASIRRTLGGPGNENEPCRLSNRLHRCFSTSLLVEHPSAGALLPYPTESSPLPRGSRHDGGSPARTLRGGPGPKPGSWEATMTQAGSPRRWKR